MRLVVWVCQIAVVVGSTGGKQQTKKRSAAVLHQGRVFATSLVPMVQSLMLSYKEVRMVEPASAAVLAEPAEDSEILDEETTIPTSDPVMVDEKEVAEDDDQGTQNAKLINEGLKEVVKALTWWFASGRTVWLMAKWGASLIAVREIFANRSERRRRKELAISTRRRKVEERAMAAAEAQMDKYRPGLFFRDEYYVPRNSIGSRIAQYVGSGLTGKHLVVVGSGGVGKSFLVNRILADRAKVVYVQLVGNSYSVQDYLRGDTTMFAPFTHGGGAEDKKPVLVVEVDRASDDRAAPWADGTMKQLCHDYGCCHGIIVADVETALKIQQNRYHEFAWVGDFTRQEANEYLDNRGTLLGNKNVDLRRELVGEVGANPQFLRSVANRAAEARGMAADNEAMGQDFERACVEDVIAAEKEIAAKDLILALAKVPDLVKIVRALVSAIQARIAAQGGPIGVEPASVGVDPKDLLDSLNRLSALTTTVVTYNPETRRFVFVSPAHSYAAVAWVAAKRVLKTNKAITHKSRRIVNHSTAAATTTTTATTSPPRGTLRLRDGGPLRFNDSSSSTPKGRPAKRRRRRRHSTPTSATPKSSAFAQNKGEDAA